MPRKAKTIKPRRPYVPVVPVGASWFESDSYDRRTWNEIVADAPSIADLAESGERLVPHFGALVQDLFFALFKMNPVFRKAGDVRLAAALNRTILEQIVPSAPFQALRSRTALEEDKAAIAAMSQTSSSLNPCAESSAKSAAEISCACWLTFMAKSSMARSRFDNRAAR